MQILAPLLPYLLLAANTILLLALFFGINQRVRQLRTRSIAGETSLKADVARISSDLNKLSKAFASLEGEGTQPAGPEPAASGLNSTLRGKVLKMHRLGQSSDRIAEILRVPRGEVELLVKVHTIVMRTYNDVAISETQGDLVKKG